MMTLFQDSRESVHDALGREQMRISQCSMQNTGKRSLVLKKQLLLPGHSGPACPPSAPSL